MKSIGIGLVVLLAGCAGVDPSDGGATRAVESTGWAVQLNRALTIDAGAATVRLQYGRIVPRNSVQEYDPFCVVELNTVGTAPQILRPGRFEVRRVTRSVNPITAARSSSFLQTAFGMDEGDSSFLYFITAFRLRDPAQPDLRGMTCAWNQMAPANRMLMRHLTLDEIRSALGDWMTLIPPREKL
jgi:hypothetical protein